MHKLNHLYLRKHVTYDDHRRGFTNMTHFTNQKLFLMSYNYMCGNTCSTVYWQSIGTNGIYFLQLLQIHQEFFFSEWPEILYSEHLTSLYAYLSNLITGVETEYFPGKVLHFALFPCELLYVCRWHFEPQFFFSLKIDLGH